MKRGKLNVDKDILETVTVTWFILQENKFSYCNSYSISKLH